jgi:hypothetical protein
MIAATVGLLTVIQAIWLQLREPKRFAHSRLVLGRRRHRASVLGGIRCCSFCHTPSRLRTPGRRVFFLNVSIAFLRRLCSAVARARKGDAPIGLTSLLVVVTFVQILIGALMRHRRRSGIPDFPRRSAHRAVVHEPRIGVNFAHRVGASVWPRS